MAYYICNGGGDSEDSPTQEQMIQFLAKLDPYDHEHCAAWLADDDGNSLEFSICGNLRFDRIDHEPRYLFPVTKEQTLLLWLQLAAGSFDELERQVWQPGSHPPLSKEDAEKRNQELAEWRLQQDRVFYDSLDQEDPSKACRSPGCNRGTVKFSVFCRRHHFENVQNRPCPFED